jgi:hypothetical protein
MMDTIKETLGEIDRRLLVAVIMLYAITGPCCCCAGFYTKRILWLLGLR